jgi:hypothetical protein
LLGTYLLSRQGCVVCEGSGDRFAHFCALYFWSALTGN